MLKMIWKLIKIVFLILVIVAIAAAAIVAVFAAIPCAIDHWIFNNEVFSKLTSTEWSGFLGSYIGGAIGGIGTLIAVSISTTQIYRQTRKKEKSEITKNALVIYYDLKFAFAEIYEVLCDSSSSHNRLVNSFIDPKWIHTVAEIAPLLNPNEKSSSENAHPSNSELVQHLYDLYGHIEILRNGEDLKNGQYQKSIDLFYNVNESDEGIVMNTNSYYVFKGLVNIICDNSKTDLNGDFKLIPGGQIFIERNKQNENFIVKFVKALKNKLRKCD